VPAAEFGKYKVLRLADRPALLLKRWRPHDVQNVLHDDLMPIYHTMESLCGGNADECFRHYRLIVADKVDTSLNPLYQIMWEAEVIYLDSDLIANETDRVICFDEAVAGLDGGTTWWEHGHAGRNPGPLDIGHIRPARLERFRNNLARKLAHFHSAFGLEYPDAVVLASGVRRQILNYNQLLVTVGEEYKRLFGAENFTAVQLNFEEHTAEHILRTLSKTRLVVGAHGPHMAATMIMPLGGVVVELFPYGISPDSFSFVANMAAIRRLNYAAVATEKRSASLAYPNRAANLGGISHLPRQLQEDIKKRSDVGRVKEDDPAYLYRLHQHTTVDLDNFAAAVKPALKKLSNPGPESLPPDFKEWLIPASVHSLNCYIASVAKGVAIKWRPPTNLAFAADTGDVSYEIAVQGQTAEEKYYRLAKATTRIPSLTLDNVNLKKVRYLNVWIAASLAGAKFGGSGSYHECDLDPEGGH